MAVDIRFNFDQLKFDLSKKYAGDNYKVLKFCLFDYIPIGTLTAKDSIGHTLFNELDAIGGSGVISPHNVDLLLEITTLTGPRDAKALVEQYIEDNNIHITDTNQLTLYRKQLYRAVTQAELGAINNLAATYGFNVTYTSLWDAVFKLESDQRLANEPRKLKKLGQNLGQFSENELLKITEGSDLNEAPQPAEPKPKENLTKPIPRETEQRPAHEQEPNWKKADKITKVVDCTGDTLYLKDEDIELVINPGAIEEGKTVDISLENIWDKTKYPVLKQFETIVSPTVRCGPPGTVFKKHCILSFPHNAVNEECWEFTLLVKESFHNKWKRVKLGSDDKDIHFSLLNGRCYINLIHFTLPTLIAKMMNFSGGKNVLFGAFGRMHLNKYHLRVRTWNPGSKNAVLEEEREFNEERLEMPTCRKLLYQDLIIRVKDINTGWQISEASQTQTFSADELWNDIPWKLFKLTRSDPPSDVLEATISSSQATNTFPELEISCEAKKHSRSPENEPGTSSQLEPRIPADHPEISRQTQRNPNELLDLNFGYIKVKFIEWYKARDSLSLLKLLYKDLVSPSVLADASNTIRDLINSLIDSSYATNRDFTLFLETIKATRQFGLGTKIQDQIVLFPDAKGISFTILKLHRIKLIDFGHALTSENVKAISDFYNEGNNPYKNRWELILDLETRKLICEENMQPFIDSLNLLNLAGPLEILTKDYH